MQGRIYISGAFTTIKRSKCGQVGWLDNDPHFWTNPPTWGICRTDYRRVVKPNDYVFFVLPKYSELPQMVYGYFRVKEKITHLDAYHCPELLSKRMGRKNPNGNIIVDEHGDYNKYDCGVHEDRFEKIKDYYVVGDETESEFLTEAKIKKIAPKFLPILNEIWDTNESTIFGVIGRKGRKMTAGQVAQLLAWLRQ